VDLSASYAPNVIDPRPGLSVVGLLGIAIVLAVVVALVAVLRRRRWPVMAFALLWIVVALAPIANVLFPTGVVLAERTLYLASIGACLAAGAVAERFLLEQWSMVAAATASIVLAFGIRTWTRTPAWRDDRTYVLTLIAEHPEAYDAHLVAGRAYKGANALDRADRELTIARRLFPRDSLTSREPAALAERRGNPALAAARRDAARIAHRLPLAR
jgi:signal transduction histidine kinase